ncbi:hypothetical protein BELL_0302g00010 [Botrytis elliptica]|uniref:RING-type domain-containing protein n=1 Tax=Botrytis elliptica TaxID=278938 RepID=A0A4Z1JKP0_9HELO|nr:hypothetical protein EAE99_009647 [Botrytis elliptica]TGO74178.1 hypothetical protein BELL_0302g00010 [Botrytis elliptica]
MAPAEVSNEMDRECVICLSSLGSNPHENEDCRTCEIMVCSTASIPSCGHQNFHYCCLKEWKDNNNHTCPCCRGPFLAIKRVLRLGARRLTGLFPPSSATFQQDRSLYVYFMGRDIERSKIYIYRLLSHPISGGFHRVTPQQIAGSDVLQRRVRDFTIREFHLAFVPLPLDIATGEEITCEDITTFVVNLLQIYDLRENVNELKEQVAFLFHKRYRGETFLHELRAWMESGHDTLDLWDQDTGYTAPTIVPYRLRPFMSQRGVPFTPVYQSYFPPNI